MEFNRLLSQAIDFYGEPDEKTNKKQDANQNQKLISQNMKPLRKKRNLKNGINILRRKIFISIDTETSSLNPIEADLVGNFILLFNK